MGSFLKPPWPHARALSAHVFRGACREARIGSSALGILNEGGAAVVLRLAAAAMGILLKPVTSEDPGSEAPPSDEVGPRSAQ